MKRITAFFAALMAAVSIYSQTPDKMSYQAIIRNTGSNLVTNQSVGMRISILQGSASGTVVYTETQTPTTNTNGLVSIEIGGGPGFSAIDWANDIYFIKTETDPTGGTNYTISGTSQLLSVPYALHAKTAENISGGITENDPDFNASIAAGITGTDTSGWNNKLDAEVDGSVTNELQILSISNDTIKLTNGGFVKLPAGFDGLYSSLAGSPTTVSSFSNDAGYITGFSETDPIWAADSSNYYTKSDMQTSSQAQLHFGNLTNRPSTLTGYDITDGVSKTELQNGSLVFNLSSGSNNAYSVILSPAVTAYTAGMMVSFKANSDNTGAATLNINDLGAKPIKKSATADLVSNDIVTDQMVTVIFDGVNFQMISESHNSSLSSSAVHGMQILTSIGTTNFIVPAGVTSLKIDMVGSGGGGPASPSMCCNGGGGGYFGGRIAVTPGENISIIIGSNGLGYTDAPIPTNASASYIIAGDGDTLVTLNGGKAPLFSHETAAGGTAIIEDTIRVKGLINDGEQSENDLYFRCAGGVVSPYSKTFSFYRATDGKTIVKHWFCINNTEYGRGGTGATGDENGHPGACIIEW